MDGFENLLAAVHEDTPTPPKLVGRKFGGKEFRAYVRGNNGAVKVKTPAPFICLECGKKLGISVVDSGRCPKCDSSDIGENPDA